MTDKKRILVVEDEGIIAKGIKSSLETLGYAVTSWVTTGEDAIQTVEKNPPDLVLMDIVLQGELDGIEAAKQIYSRFAVPVVYLTAYADESTLERAKVTQPFGYLLKPFEDRELNTSIEIALYKHQVEKKLKESEKRFKSLVSNVPGAIYRCANDANWTMKFISPAIEELSGYPYTDFLQNRVRSYASIMHPDDRKMANDLAQEALRQKEAFVLEYRIIHADGSIRWVYEKGQGTFDDQEELLWLDGAIFDQTDQKKAEDALRYEHENLINILGSMEDGVYIGNKDYDIEYCNAAIKKEFDAKKGNKCYSVFFGREEPCPWCKNSEVFQGKTVRWDFQYEKNNKTYDCLDTPIRKPDGTISKLKILHDITQRKRMEEELIKAKEKAEEATKLKDKFVSLVSHDLRSPFISITGFLNLLMKDEKEPLHPKHKQMLERVQESSNRLLTMLDELLEIGRLQTGKIALNPSFIDGRLAAALALSYMEHQACEKGIKLSNEVLEGTRLYADSQLFGQVLLNLVSNAIKFCGKGDTVTFFVPTGKKTSIALRDTGTGISDTLIPSLFAHEIKTSTSGTKGEKGTGLGLPLSHDIMKAHGGTLKAESKKGDGSVFYADLPHVRPKILVVDDEESARFMIKELLEDLDVEIVEAKGGAEALKLMEKDPPHLAILDLIMPGMDGFELLENLQKNPQTDNIPVVVITSDQNVETRQNAFQMGASDFAAKPVLPEDLIPRVRRFIN